jgi:1-acyl-sn-glycerol-3-phosphate acyltransferase
MYLIQELLAIFSKSYIVTLFLRLCLYRFYTVFGGLMLHFILPKPLMKFAFKFSLLGFNVYNTTETEFEEVNNNKIEDFYTKETKGVILFNHPSFLDAFVLSSVIDKDKVRPVAYAPYFRFPLNLFSDTFDPIYVQIRSTGVSTIIKDTILSRQRKDKIIFMAPGGADTNESQRVMSKFKSGGFLAKAPILPVVIRYTENVNKWPIISSLIKRLVYFTPVYFKIRVLDPIYPIEDENLEDLKMRVKNKMESVPDYKNLHF